MFLRKMHSFCCNRGVNANQSLLAPSTVKCFTVPPPQQKRPQWASSKDQLKRGLRIRLMHALGTAQLCTKGSGVWGDKSHVLFVNDKAIISLVLHRGEKKIFVKIQTRIPRETMELVGWKSVFFFLHWEQTNGHWEQQTCWGRSYWQTHWQPAPKVLSNLGRETVGERKEGWKKDTKWEERKRRKGGRIRASESEEAEREQRGWWWDERKDKWDFPSGPAIKALSFTAGHGFDLVRGIKISEICVACKKIF